MTTPQTGPTALRDRQIASRPPKTTRHTTREPRRTPESTPPQSQPRTTHRCRSDGTYLQFVPAGVIGRVVEEWPEAFFDGRLLVAPYAELSSQSARRQTVAAATGYLNDVAWLASGPVGASREAVLRARISLDLLPGELVPLAE